MINGDTVMKNTDRCIYPLLEQISVVIDDTSAMVVQLKDGTVVDH